MDLVTCVCKSCNDVLCISTNDWTEVTSSYTTYDVPASFSHPGLEQSGHPRPGSEGSELDGCTVQPLHCINCQESVGVKCVIVAPGKEHHRDRCFLKLGKLIMNSIVTRKTVDANIKKSASRPDANSSAAVNSIRNHAPRGKSSSDHAAFARRDLSSGDDDDPVQPHPNTMQILKHQETDIIAILNNMEAIQQEMRSVRGAADEIRAWKVDQLDHPVVEMEDIEMLTNSVSNVSSKVGEIDALKLEMKMMQSRIKRLEDEKRALQTGSGMFPPSTPKHEPNSSKPAQSSVKPLPERLLGTPRHNTPNSHNDAGPSRYRAASVQIGPSRLTPRSPHSSRPDMPPPEAPSSIQNKNLATANPSKSSPLRSASETAPRRRSNLHNTITALKDNAHEFSKPPQEGDDDDDDDEYRPDNDNGPDPDETEEEELTSPRRRTTSSHHHRQSLPARIDGQNIDIAPDGHHSVASPNPHKRRRTTTTDLSLDDSPPSPHPSDPDYTSIWAPEQPHTSGLNTGASAQRNERGFIIKGNGQIDKRSLRFYGKPKVNKKKFVKQDAPRDAEGYLLNPDGKRNKRSVKIIEGLRKKEKMAEEMGLGGLFREESEES